MAKVKSKKTEVTTLSFIDKLHSPPVPSTKVEFQGEAFSVIHRLPINTVNLICNLVVNNVFTYDEENTLTYNPMALDIVWDYCKVRYLTTIPLPENMDANDVYDLAHRTGLIGVINCAIPLENTTYIYSKLVEAIEAKKYMIAQENNILNILHTIIKNVPTPEAIASISEQVKGFDFSQLKILSPDK